MRHTLKSLLLVALVAAACGGPGSQLPDERRASRKALQKELAAFEKPGLVIGTFPLDRVVDGDTIHVVGLDSSLRLLCDDTEETFKHESERRAYEEGWELYQKNMRGNSPRPVKFATPVGDEAKVWAEKFFAGAQNVELERDSPREIRDYYNRYLAYVFVTRPDGKRENYNVEVIRAGYSPYFSKYGYSRRFHDEFVKAEAEARAAKRGIWDPTKRHYPDYDERKPWWDGRAEFIKKFEDEAVNHTNYIALTAYDTPERLEEMVGKEVVLLGAISEIKLGDKGPTMVMLSRRRGNDFPLIFFDRDVFMSSGASKLVGEYIKVRGYVTKYQDDKRGRYQLQIKIDTPGQIESMLTEKAGHASTP